MNFVPSYFPERVSVKFRGNFNINVYVAVAQTVKKNTEEVWAILHTLKTFWITIILPSFCLGPAWFTKLNVYYAGARPSERLQVQASDKKLFGEPTEVFYAAMQECAHYFIPIKVVF